MRWAGPLAEPGPEVRREPEVHAVQSTGTSRRLPKSNTPVNPPRGGGLDGWCKIPLEATTMTEDAEDAAKSMARGREAIARPDPILFLMRLPREVVRNAIVDRFCDEMNYIQGEARRATASE